MCKKGFLAIAKRQGDDMAKRPDILYQFDFTPSDPAVFFAFGKAPRR